MNFGPFSNLTELAQEFRNQLLAPNAKNFTLLYAYNGTGKTRLSTAFKDIAKQAGTADTLYFNAFTEDLFSWDNDLDEDSERYLELHESSNFLTGLAGVDMDTKVYEILKLFADFEFDFDDIPIEDENGNFIRSKRIVRFSRKALTEAGSTKAENIKVSRSEENLFIWCFYLAVLQMVLEGDAAYDWVNYIYIDDPISSMDEGNAIAIANHLAHMLTKSGKVIPTLISSHHALFFNVLCNELRGKVLPLHLKNAANGTDYLLSPSGSSPFLHHLANLVELDKAQATGDIKRHHFNMLRCIMEQTAIYCGLDRWSDCIKFADTELDKALHKRMIDVMSHADYLIQEPEDLNERFKEDFRAIFRKFIANHSFNRALVPNAAAQ
jgi:hypothetical protein